MRIGKHIPRGRANEDHNDGDGMVMIKVLELGKEEREKQNRLKAKVNLIGPFCFSDQDT